MMINKLFRAIDGKDLKSFTSFLSPDCAFKFGNLPAVVGMEEIEKFVEKAKGDATEWH